MMKNALFALFLAATMAACAHPQAKTVATAPDIPLDVPLPPSRAVEPITADALPVVGPVPEPGRGAAPRQARPAPTPQSPSRADAPHVDAPHVEPAPAEPPKPVDDTASKPATPQQPGGAPTLQITPTQREGEVEAQIRAQLSRATTDLNRVDYGRLSTAARSQYDFAKRSVSQAEDAIRARNLPFAQALADKAADVAAQLAGR